MDQALKKIIIIIIIMKITFNLCPRCPRTAPVLASRGSAC